MNTPASVPSFEIFASYSHRDTRFVKPMVQYLRPTGASVFRDEESIAPGKKWTVVIADAIESCRIMYLFWCSHSAGSAEVRKEYEQALALRKDIVPVLLDDTPLPSSLAEYQWVDLRQIIGEHEKLVEQKIPFEEGQSGQQLDREKHGYGPNEHGYFGGDFARQGWEPRGDQYVRQVRVDKEITDDSMQRAAGLLSANLERRIRKQ